jgi:hypothetical protein
MVDLHKNDGLSTFLRYFEYILLLVFIGILVWIGTQVQCVEDSCVISSVTEESTIRAIQVNIIVFGVISTFRTWYRYFVNNHDSGISDFDILYLVSVVSQTISYVLIGVFINDILVRSQIGYLSSSVLFILTASVGISILSLVFDKKFWDNSIAYVRIRLTISLLFQILLLFNPLLALVASLIIIPTMILLRD